MYKKSIRKTINKEKIIVKVDGKLIETQMPDIQLGKAVKLINLSNLTFQEKETNIVFYPGALEDIYGRKNDTIKIAFKPFEIDDLGSVSFSLKLYSFLHFSH